MASRILTALLPPETDADILTYLGGTVDSTYEESEDAVTVSTLAEALSDLLLSYELAPDEDAALDICSKLHVRMGQQTTSNSAFCGGANGAPPALLSAPLTMGTDDERVASDPSAFSGTDAFGNKVSAAGLANAKWKSDSLAAAEKASREKDEEVDAGGVQVGMRLQTKAQQEEQARRDAAALKEAQRARERACELYLDSKASGGSRDVSIKSLILLAPNGKPLLEDGAALRLSEGRRYGLVGRNGTGKTTLLHAIASYSISGFPAHLKVVHVEQDPAIDLDASALSLVLAFDLEARVLTRRIEELRTAVARAAAEPPPAAELGEDERAKLLKANEKVHARLVKRLADSEALLGEIATDSAHARAAAILSGLQFSPAMMEAPLRTLSGGWRMRANLAAALFVPCDLLLLDEPTNHLDFPAVDWLTSWLQQSKATALVVSHDRGFLDDIVTDVVQLKSKGLHYHRGNVSSYVEVQRELYISQKRRYEAQQKERAHMQEMLDKYDVTKNSSAENKKNKRTPGVIAQMKSREKALNKMEEEGLVVDPDAKQDEATIAIEFPDPWPLKRPLLVSLNDVSFAYRGGAAAGGALLSGISLSVSIGSRVGVLGPNGCGKSTLLKLMTQQLQPSSGECSLNRGARTAVFAQHFVEQLDLHATATEFLAAKFVGAKETEIRSRLARFGLVEWMSWLPMGKLSGGQKSRVVLCAIMWSQPTLLFLDEPTNHLDMETVDVLATALKNFKGAVVAVSHDVYFLKTALSEFWSLRDGTLTRFVELEEAKRHAKRRPLAEGLVDVE